MDSRSLRTRIDRHRRSASYPHRYPDDLRQEIVAQVRARRASGESIETVAESLGMSPFTLYEWLRHGPRLPAAGFRRVQVESSPVRQAALVTPGGYRLEGDAESLAAVLRALL